MNLLFYSLEVQHRSHWAKINVLTVKCFLEALGESLIPCPLKAAHIPWLFALLHLQSQQ